MELSVDQVFGKAELMSHDNNIAEVEIALVIKKIQVLRPITFGGCNFPQEIQNSIEVLKPITFKNCSSF